MKIPKMNEKIIIIIAVILSSIFGVMYFGGALNIDRFRLPIEMNGGSGGYGLTHSPYGMVIFPESGAEVGYHEKDLNANYIFTFVTPIKIVIHDADGDIRHYTVKWRVSDLSWGDLDGSESFSVLSTGSISSTVYDREIITTFTFKWTYLGVPAYTNLLLTIELEFYMYDEVVDGEKNEVTITHQRTIDYRYKTKADFNLPIGENIEDNTVNPNQDIEDYLNDPYDNWNDAYTSPFLTIDLFILSFVGFIVLHRKKRLKNRPET